MFNESNTTEAMLLSALQSSGWKYLPPNEIPRSASDVIAEPMLRNALIRLNPEIAQNPSRADEVIHRLRNFISTVQPQNLVSHNERFKRMLFDENSYPFGQDGEMTSVKFFGPANQNEYVITNQWTFPRKDGGKRLDIVLLINGFPVAVGEMKSPVRAAVSWLDGANDILSYEKSIPEMFVPNVLNFATDGKKYRYGAVNMPVNFWCPWRVNGNQDEGTLLSVRESVTDMLTPEKVLDIMQNFTLFATDKHYRKYKIICRRQQYEAANLIVKRVVAGYPKKGLIWHFQGSGKSLLMVFAAQKLRMTPELKNPTVVIVLDRLDLETQISSTFNAADVPNMAALATKEELLRFFRQDMRKVAITTIFRFDDADGVLNERGNIIVMADEAHRTQEGDLGLKMRTALPNAFFFGLTGTPINRTDKNTFRTFGAVEDKSGYMSRYTFGDSVRDGATLPLNFETALTELHVDREKIDREFDALTADLTDEERSELVRRIGIRAIMSSPERVKRICEHIVSHYRERIEPNGCKGMIVAYDRECCMMYKRELDRLMPQEASTVVIDTNNDKAGRYSAYRRERDEEAKILDRFRERSSPLKLLIVTSKLLTGFDAPILQVMYLDKPMRDHTLIQAVCRTNRTYDGKTHGLVVDYVGVFDNAGESLRFDEAEMRDVVRNIEEVKKQIPDLVKKCLDYFPGADWNITGWKGLELAQKFLQEDNIKDAFGADYRVLNRAWEYVSPDKILSQYEEIYCWLSRVYESVRQHDGIGALVWAELGAKTLELIHRNIEADEIKSDDEIRTLDGKFDNESKSEHHNIETDLTAKISKHKCSVIYQQLGEKVERLKRQLEIGQITNTEYSSTLCNLMKEAEKIEKLIENLTELFRGMNVSSEQIIHDIEEKVKPVMIDDWQHTTEGSRQVKAALRGLMWLKYGIRNENMFDTAYKYIEQYCGKLFVIVE